MRQVQLDMSQKCQGGGREGRELMARLALMMRFLPSTSISDVVTVHIIVLGNESETRSAGVVAGRVGRLE